MRQKTTEIRKSYQSKSYFHIDQAKAVKTGELNSDIQIYWVYEYCKKEGINAVN